VLVLAAAALSLLAVPLLRGRWAGLLGLQLRLPVLPAAALLAQVLVIEVVPDGSAPVLAAVHVGTYVLAGVFLWANRRVPGLLVLGAGALLNGAVIALNGGILPASESAMAAAGVRHDPAEFTNSGALADPTLGWLGDVYAWPEPMPLANVFSVGDVLIVAGVWVAVLRLTWRGAPARDQAAAGEPGAAAA
jgi:hypothetical protein